MFVKASAFMLLAPLLTHADVDIVVSQEGPDVGIVISGSLKTDVYASIGKTLPGADRIHVYTFQSSSQTVPQVHGAVFRQESIDLGMYKLETKEAAEGSIGSLAGCATTRNASSSPFVADGSFGLVLASDYALVLLAPEYESESPLNIIGRLPGTTTEYIFATPDQFPCTLAIPTGSPGAKQSVTIRMAPPAAAPAFLEAIPLAGDIHNPFLCSLFGLKGPLKKLVDIFA